MKFCVLLCLFLYCPLHFSLVFTTSEQIRNELFLHFNIVPFFIHLFFWYNWYVKCHNICICLFCSIISFGWYSLDLFSDFSIDFWFHQRCREKVTRFWLTLFDILTSTVFIWIWKVFIFNRKSVGFFFLHQRLLCYFSIVNHFRGHICKNQSFFDYENWQICLFSTLA